MTLRLQDTLTGEVRAFEPLEPGHVRIYTCGPTVYGPAHIGNFRSFLFADLLVRYLRYGGLRVTWVMNLTDIDDKIIRGARAAGASIEDLAAGGLDRFLADAAALRLTPPDVLPRATHHIDDIVRLIAALEANGHAYRTDDGSDLLPDLLVARLWAPRAPGPEQLRVGERVEADEYGKDDVRDFALWKGPKPDEPSWETAIGRGRPGWHIECSAMSMRHLGESFDIHTGGVDLSSRTTRTRSPRARRRREALRPDLAALRPPADGRREDGEVERQHRPRRRPPRGGCLAVRPPLRPDRRPLPQGLDYSDATLEAPQPPRAARHAPGGPRWLRRGAGAIRRSRTCWTGRGRRSRPRSMTSQRLAAWPRSSSSPARRTTPRSRSISKADTDRVIGLLATWTPCSDPAGGGGGTRAGAVLAARGPRRREGGPRWARPDQLATSSPAGAILVDDTRDGQRRRRVEMARSATAGAATTGTGIARGGPAPGGRRRPGGPGPLDRCRRTWPPRGIRCARGRDAAGPNHGPT